MTPHLEGRDESVAFERENDRVDCESDAVNDFIREPVLATGSVRGRHAPGLTSGLNRPQILTRFDLNTNLKIL